MENLFKDFDAGIRFDLKGSFNNRTRLTEGQTIYGGPGRDIMVSLKDNDFRTHMKKITFVESLNHNFPPHHLVIEKDVDFVTCSSHGHFDFDFNPNFIISTKKDGFNLSPTKKDF